MLYGLSIFCSEIFKSINREKNDGENLCCWIFDGQEVLFFYNKIKWEKI